MNTCPLALYLLPPCHKILTLPPDARGVESAAYIYDGQTSALNRKRKATMMKSRPRLMRRGHKFTGRHAHRNHIIYESYRLGVSANGLATAWKLTRGRLWQIIAEGNGGSMRARYLDELLAA
jgi:hypothetical protein